MLLAGIVALHLAVLWAATLMLSRGDARHVRIPQERADNAMLVLAVWVAPSVIAALMASVRGVAVAALGFVLSAAGLRTRRARRSRASRVWYRRATVAARILALFLAFLVPTLLLHPSVDFFAERATRKLIVTEYAVQAQNHVQTLRARLDEARAASRHAQRAAGAGLRRPGACRPAAHDRRRVPRLEADRRWRASG